MLSFDAGRLLILVNGLSNFVAGVRPNVPLAIPIENHQTIKGNIDFICEELARLDLPLPLVSASELSKIINNEFEERKDARLPGGRAIFFQPLVLGRIRNFTKDLVTRLKDALSAKTILILTEGKAALYEPKEPIFGKSVNDNFQASGVFEIDEAAKCLALNRPTACVFHLMRTLEVGISAVRLCLGIPDPVRQADRNWGAILRILKEELDRRNKPIPKIWNGNDGDFFSEIYVSLDAVRNVWRNATMHVEKKYVPEEAEHIFNAVRGLMMKLSSRMDENGLPLA